jgi:exosortase family protein XrtG
MIITQEVGWTVVQITIECSGLLETGALAGMVLLYPGWSWRKRTLLTIGGVVAIFAANIIRLLFIVDILHYTGKDSIFISHTIAGRAIFFIIVVGIYWWVLTRPTLNDIGNRLRKELSA